MSTKSSNQHVHKLKRHRFKSGNVVYFCAQPDCNFKINPALALGKRSICWRCGEPFIMNEYSIRLAKPHCDNCHKIKGMLPEVMSGYDNSIGVPASVANDTVSDLKTRMSSLFKREEEDDGEI